MYLSIIDIFAGIKSIAYKYGRYLHVMTDDSFETSAATGLHGQLFATY